MYQVKIYLREPAELVVSGSLLTKHLTTFPIPFFGKIMTSIKQLAIRGTIWTVASYGSGQVIRFGSNLILTRLLAPELFGLMTLVTIFIVGLHLFSDVGLGPSIVQNKRGDDPEFLNTAWTIQVIRGFVIWGFCLVIAFPLSHFYNEPQLLWLLPIAGLETVIGSFSSTTGFSLNRHMEVRLSTLFTLGSQITSVTIMIIWAKLSPTIWALVMSSLLNALIRTVWSYFLIPGTRHRFAWNPEAVRDLSNFGRSILLSTAITFLAGQIDRLILGKFSFELLGVYGVANALAEIPRQVLLTVSDRVFFPAFTKMIDQPREVFLSKIMKSRMLLLLAFAVGLTLLVSFGDFLILKLFDKRYVQASWMVPVLAAGFWPRVLTLTIDQVFLSMGKPQIPTLGNLAKFVFMLVAIPGGFHFLGISGTILMIALNDVPYYAVVSEGLRREKIFTLSQDLQATLVLVGLTTVIIVGRVALGFGNPFHGFLYF